MRWLCLKGSKKMRNHFRNRNRKSLDFELQQWTPQKSYRKFRNPGTNFENPPFCPAKYSIVQSERERDKNTINSGHYVLPEMPKWSARTPVRPTFTCRALWISDLMSGERMWYQSVVWSGWRTNLIIFLICSHISEILSPYLNQLVVIVFF